MVSFGLLLVASWLFFFRIGYHSLWVDELLTAGVVIHESQAEIWEPHHYPTVEGKFGYGALIPYFSLVKVWCSIFGSSEAGLRSLSACSAMVALVMILVWGPHVWMLGYKASLTAAAIFVLSPMMLWYAQEARYYAFLQPLALAVVGCYFQYWKTGRWEWLVSWTLCSIFSIMAHPLMIFGIATISCYGIWYWQKNRFPHTLIVFLCHSIVGIYFLLVIRVLTTAYGHLSQYYSEISRTFSDEFMLWKVLLHFLCGIEERPVMTSTLLLIFATAVLVVYVHGLWVRQQSSISEFEAERGLVSLRGYNPAILWMVASLGVCALMMGISYFRPMMAEAKRYPMVFFAPFCVCLGSARVSRFISRFAFFLFVGVMALNTAMVDGVYFTTPQKQNWRWVSTLIQRFSQEGDVWLHPSSVHRLVSDYYGGKREGIRVVVWEPPELKKELPSELKKAHRVWMAVSWRFPDILLRVYALRLQEVGFRAPIELEVPNGTNYQIRLWLFERSSS